MSEDFYDPAAARAAKKAREAKWAAKAAGVVDQEEVGRRAASDAEPASKPHRAGPSDDLGDAFNNGPRANAFLTDRHPDVELLTRSDVMELLKAFGRDEVSRDRRREGRNKGAKRNRGGVQNKRVPTEQERGLAADTTKALELIVGVMKREAERLAVTSAEVYFDHWKAEIALETLADALKRGIDHPSIIVHGETRGVGTPKRIDTPRQIALREHCGKLVMQFIGNGMGLNDAMSTVQSLAAQVAGIELKPKKIKDGYEKLDAVMRNWHFRIGKSLSREEVTTRAKAMLWLFSAGGYNFQGAIGSHD